MIITGLMCIRFRIFAIVALHVEHRPGVVEVMVRFSAQTEKLKAKSYTYCCYVIDSMSRVECLGSKLVQLINMRK